MFSANVRLDRAACRLPFAILLACVVVTGCTRRYPITVVGPKGNTPEVELVVCELVTRNLVADQPRGETILVSFGESWSDHVDPPAAFFDRLADTHVSLEPVSRHERLATKNTLLFAVQVTEWLSPTEANVSVTRFRFGVGAADGFTAKVKWRDGTWRISKSVHRWSV